ncbi:MAG: hypothetical protein RSE00_05890 [Clostridia bacterium]
MEVVLNESVKFAEVEEVFEGIVKNRGYSGEYLLSFSPVVSGKCKEFSIIIAGIAIIASSIKHFVKEKSGVYDTIKLKLSYIPQN